MTALSYLAAIEKGGATTRWARPNADDCHMNSPLHILVAIKVISYSPKLEPAIKNAPSNVALSAFILCHDNKFYNGSRIDAMKFMGLCSFSNTSVLLSGFPHGNRRQGGYSQHWQ